VAMSPPSTTGKSWIASTPGGLDTPLPPYTPQPRPADNIGYGISLGPKLLDMNGPLPPLLASYQSGSPCDAGMRFEGGFTPWKQPVGEGLVAHAELPNITFPGLAPVTPLRQHPSSQIHADDPPRLAEWFKVEPLHIPSFTPPTLTDMHRVAPPKLPTVSLFGSDTTRTWLEKPGVEIALETIFIDGLDVASLPAEALLLPLEISKDNEKCLAKIGRQHQQDWFESKLDPSNVNCISRTAFEIMWTGTEDSSASVFALQVLGTSIVHVNNLQIQPGQLSPLLPNARITLCSQDGVPMVSFIAHFKCCVAKQSVPCETADLPKFSFSSARKRHERTSRPYGNTWWLACDYTNGLSKEDVQALPAKDAMMAISVEEEGSNTVVGRQHQSDIFTALLRGAPQFLQLVSRSHFKLEKYKDSIADSSDEKLILTNLSQNAMLIDDFSLVQFGETSVLQDGQKIQFTAHDNVPFLSFRLVAPRLISQSSRSQLLALLAPDESSVSAHREGTDRSSTTLTVADESDIAHQVITEARTFQRQQPQEMSSAENVGFLEECGAALLDANVETTSSLNASLFSSPVAKVKELNPNTKILGSPPSPMSEPPKCGCFGFYPGRSKNGGC